MDVKHITDWLLSEARFKNRNGEFETALIEKLLGQGVPVNRFTTGVPSLHPQVNSFSTLWERGKELEYREFRQSAQQSGAVSSPIFAAYETGKHQRHLLTEPATKDEYPLLAEFRERGMTDYLVLALPFSDGSFKAMSFGTDQAGGFSEPQIALLEALVPGFANVLEIHHLQRISAVLVETYVGRFAGRRVLQGDIRRGSGETINAVIWFCDLKGFTQLSETLAAERLVQFLNQYFEIITEVIDQHGGEVLKFIGDAILAIFPGDDETVNANQALTAAKAARERIAVFNTHNDDDTLPMIECGIALHTGAVTYGNVGGISRLDFTVIGPAVNLASRIESMTRTLKREVLVSAAFAAICDAEFHSLGHHSLKGIEQDQEIFSPQWA